MCPGGGRIGKVGGDLVVERPETHSNLVLSEERALIDPKTHYRNRRKMGLRESPG